MNVASVPQRSPFRYPGGKTWLVPRIREWLDSVHPKPSLFVEPFAGGGIVGLTVAFENLAEHVLLIELDEQISAVWSTILSDENEWLAERILSFELTQENVLAELGQTNGTTRDAAFRTILKNRTFHGGILAPGSSLIKSGENGKGLKSRWYASTLAHRVREIAKHREKISFLHGDGIAFMAQNGRLKRNAFFIDPPYTAAGKKAGSRLYTYHKVDHDRIFEICSKLAGSFLMTYDNAEEVATLARNKGLQTRTVPMKNTHHEKMLELLISKDFSWLGT